MASHYKLSYFRLRARAEPARLVFAYAGVDYEDIRIDWFNKEQEWTPIKDSGKFPFGQVPILEVEPEGVTISQSMTILRFLAGRYGLMPSNDIEQAKADMFSEAIHDLENAFIRAVADPDKNQQKVLMAKCKSETAPKACIYLEKFLDKNPKDEVYCVGNKLSYADISFFAFFNSYLGGGETAVPDALKDHPRLTALYEKVRDEPKITAWIEKRPKTPL